jgi:hypothetical protein
VQSVGVDKLNPATKTIVLPYYDNKLKRWFDTDRTLTIGTDQVTAAICEKKNFKDFIEWIHGAGHFGIHSFLGFSMKTLASPDEPLFFMHHCNVDRFFHIWADCHEYDKISETALGDAQYYEVNPVGGSSDKTVRVGDAKSPAVRVLLDTEIPLYGGTGSSSCIFAPNGTWPRIKQTWTMGTAEAPGPYGLYVRYGPDIIAEFISADPKWKSLCETGSTWSWVNYKGSSKKRDVVVDERETEVYNNLIMNIRKKIDQGLSPLDALHEVAIEDCELMPKKTFDKKELEHLRMMGMSPRSLDRICDEPSDDFGWGT